MPLPQLDNDDHILLSSLDETVIQHETEFNLGIHKYEGNNYSPNGHKYIREFDCQATPKTIYRVGGVILSKEKVFTTSENNFIIKYTLLEANSPTKLRFKPLLAFRNVNQLTQENQVVNKNYTEIENGIKTCMYQGYPELYMQFNKRSTFVFQPHWYKGIEYPKDMERGLPYKEDLYVPGYFELSISNGESIYFSAGIAPTKTMFLKDSFDKEVATRTPRTSFYNCLKNSAEQFYYQPREKETYLLAGYPWFKVRARDLFISTPGCTLSINNLGRFERIFNTASEALRKFMVDGEEGSIIKEIDAPDVLLWAVWSIQQFSKNQGKAKCLENYGALVMEIIDYLRSNKHPKLHMDENGLLYAKSINGEALTWMNSQIDGRPIIPRSGYIVEFNALWYNALKFAAELSEFQKNTANAGLLEAQASKTGAAFIDTFVNGYDYLFDYIDGEYADWSVRPNMIIAAALDYSPLSKTQKRAVINIVTKELLTPKGLRSLSPKSEGYNPYCYGSQRERDLAYHQGTAWPWLLGFYLEAYLKLYNLSGISFAERMLIGLEEEMSMHCIGSISELFDGNPPFQGRGAISFAMNVAMTLRVVKLLESYDS
ncbi:4-alpha-glucanotransferase [Bacteroidales bacterium]|nr:4-alpha-glucanotransferase [Bacteroidales bacterium]